MEADFQRFYGLDLLDLWRGKLTPRKVSVLAVALPAGAVTWQLAGVDSAWTTTDHLLAQVVDVLNGANWQRAGGKDRDKPKPVLRPAEIHEARERQERVLARAKAFRDRHRVEPSQE